MDGWACFIMHNTEDIIFKGDASLYANSMTIKGWKGSKACGRDKRQEEGENEMK